MNNSSFDLIYYFLEIRELQIAEGRFLNYDERPRVLKRGGTTGETEGLLVDDSFSVCLDQVANDNESDECGFIFLTDALLLIVSIALFSNVAILGLVYS